MKKERTELMLNAYDKEIFVRTYSSFVEGASSIPGFVVAQKEDVPYDITELANAYCEARKVNDEALMSSYISALMIRYWHLVPYLYEKSKNSVSSLYEVIEWVYDGIERACRYESWNDPSKPISKDPKGAEKCINQSITSSRQRFYTDSNRQKRRDNYGIMYTDGDLDSIFGCGDIRDEYAEEYEFEYVDLVESFVKKNDYLSAIILDTIMFGDSFDYKKVGKKEYEDYDENGNEFVNSCDVKSYEYNKRRVYETLKGIDESYIDYFCERYGASKSKAKDEADRLHQDIASSAVITKCFQRLKSDRSILEYVR